MTVAVEFERSQAIASRLAELVPGGSHTYAKGADQYPERSPGVIARGRGSHVWDADGNEFIEYGMGLRAVALGHAYPSVVAAVRDALDLGTNFTRPAALELTAAERFLDTISWAEMVKFTKDGSTATSAAVRLARRATGRDLVGICSDHPFFSYDDWFMSTTTADGGIPSSERERRAAFEYGDLGSVDSMFADHPDRVAAVILEPVRGALPPDGFLAGLRERCDRHGAVLVFDEMITGFRLANGDVASRYGVLPDLATFGKALANGFSVSALCGRAVLMNYGSRRDERDDVFLLSTTHGAEVSSLAAAIATLAVYHDEPVAEHLDRVGRRLAEGLSSLAATHGVEQHVAPVGFPANLAFTTLDADGEPSQTFRTLFLQELIRRGVLGPSLVVSYSHDDDDVDRTLTAIDGALAVYAAALHDGPADHLHGRPSRHVFDRRWL